MKKDKLNLQKFKILSLQNLSKFLGGTGTTGNNSQDCDTNTNPPTTDDTGDTTEGATSETAQTAGTRPQNPPTTIAPGGTSSVPCTDMPG